MCQWNAYSVDLVTLLLIFPLVNMVPIFLIDSSWWWGSCVAVLSGVLLFTGVTTSMYINNHRLSWNLVVTEEGRYVKMVIILLVDSTDCSRKT